jgi:putative transposase
VDWISRALAVSRGGFYAWLSERWRRRSDEELSTKVRTTSSPAIEPMEPGGCGKTCWRNASRHASELAIDAITGAQSLASRVDRRSIWVSGRFPPSLNVLDRTFAAPTPNRKWIADFIYLWTGRLTLSGGRHGSILTACGRLIDDCRDDSQFVTDALMMAIWRRGKLDALLHHSDRGSQHTREQFRELLAEHGLSAR